MNRRAAMILSVLAAGVGFSFALAQPQTAGGLPNPRPVLTRPLTGLEREIGELVQQRASTAPAQLPALNLRIDLRLITQWTFERAAAAEPWSDAQLALFLRARALEEAISWADRLARSPTPPATSSMAELHHATFSMRPPTSLAEADEQARRVATALVSVLDPPLAGVNLLPWRPTTPVWTIRSGAAAATGSPPVPTDVDSLAARVRALDLSVDLQRQLELVVSATRSASGRDAEALRSALATMVRLAEGLAGEIGVSAAGRSELERDLARTAALYSDPRLRERAAERLRTLEPYARLLDRVQRLGLTPAQLAAYRPAIEHARTASDGPQLLGAIEAFLRLSAEAAAKYPNAPDLPEPLAGLSPLMPLGLRGHAESMVRRTLEARSAFDVAAATVAPADMLAAVESLRHAMTLLDLLPRVPGAVDALAGVRTRPPFVLDRRLAQNLAAACGAGTDAAARQFVADFVALGQAARLRWATDVPDDVLTRFAAPRATVEAKVAAVVAEQLQQLASGAAADRGKLERIAALSDLAAGLLDASELVDLSRRPAPTWADLQVREGTMQQLVHPLAAELRMCVAGFMDGDAAAFGRHRDALGRIRLLRDHLAALHAARVPAPPRAAGNPREEAELRLIQTLLTPMDVPGFGVERYLSLSATLAPRDEGAAFPQPLLEGLLERLARSAPTGSTLPRRTP